jgi:hypothetical protein
MKYTVDKLCKNIYSIDRYFNSIYDKRIQIQGSWRNPAEKELVLTH